MKSYIKKYANFVIKKPVLILFFVFAFAITGSIGISNFKLDASSDVIGHTLPISVLAGSSIDLSKAIATSTSGVKKAAPKVTQELEQSIQLPQLAKTPTGQEEEAISSVPLPGQSKPVAIVEEKVETIIETELTDRKAAKATENAFEGAFGIAVSYTHLRAHET